MLAGDWSINLDDKGGDAGADLLQDVQTCCRLHEAEQEWSHEWLPLRSHYKRIDGFFVSDGPWDANDRKMLLRRPGRVAMHVVRRGTSSPQRGAGRHGCGESRGPRGSTSQGTRTRCTTWRARRGASRRRRKLSAAQRRSGTATGTSSSTCCMNDPRGAKPSVPPWLAAHRGPRMRRSACDARRQLGGHCCACQIPGMRETGACGGRVARQRSERRSSVGSSGHPPSADRRTRRDAMASWAKARWGDASTTAADRAILRATTNKLDGTDLTPIPGFAEFCRQPKGQTRGSARAGRGPARVAARNSAGQEADHHGNLRGAVVGPGHEATRSLGPFCPGPAPQATQRLPVARTSAADLCGRGAVQAVRQVPLATAADAVVAAAGVGCRTPRPQCRIPAVLPVPRGGVGVVLSLDVEAAFDSLRPAQVATQLYTRGASPTHVAVLLREAAGARVMPRIGGVKGRWQELEKGFRQGAAGSPEAWNHTVAGPLEAAPDRVESTLGPAIPWSAKLSRWGLLVWTDIL